ncbi:MAG: hypothetical protein H0W65_05320 [Sphingomonas sp.]|uniref:hypothetical protein n=1 Tax=Sphingomonas sp. TaxID=28214 RepID=UPI0017DB4A04|nr:hypothetical protein [Sphingomonas sp.]MBA3667124.1 hypothetical protein [Sphingomonas sp.]
MNRLSIFAIGIAATLGVAALWHALGAGDRFAQRAELISRRTLDYYELPQVGAQLERHPMARRLILSGPANDFQHTELVRVLDQVPGVIEVRWDPASPVIPYRTRP